MTPVPDRLFFFLFLRLKVLAAGLLRRSLSTTYAVKGCIAAATDVLMPPQRQGAEEER